MRSDFLQTKVRAAGNTEDAALLGWADLKNAALCQVYANQEAYRGKDAVTLLLLPQAGYLMSRAKRVLSQSAAIGLRSERSLAWVPGRLAGGRTSASRLLFDVAEQHGTARWFTP